MWLNLTHQSEFHFFEVFVNYRPTNRHKVFSVCNYCLLLQKIVLIWCLAEVFISCLKRYKVLKFLMAQKQTRNFRLIKIYRLLCQL